MKRGGSHVSLFSGVGMTDLAAERLGFTTVATAEIDPWCRTVLAARFPNAWHFSDVRQVRLEHFKGALSLARPLLISGGFPCQDVTALASRAQGLDGQRSGLWTHFARVIREFRPDYVLIENSPMLFQSRVATSAVSAAASNCSDFNPAKTKATSPTRA